MSDKFKIFGCVLGPDGLGIHGMLVDVYDRDLAFYAELGSKLTNAEGRFYFEYEKNDELEKIFDESLAVYIVVRDTDGEGVFYSDEFTFKAGSEARFDIRLDEKDIRLERHVRKAQLDPPTGGILGDENFKVLCTAWDNLAKTGRPVRDRKFNRAWLYPLPPLVWREDLIIDALSVINGDPTAAHRFRRELDRLTDSPGHSNKVGFTTHHIELPGGVQAVLNIIKQDQIVSPDTVIALAGAATLVAQGDPSLEQRYRYLVADLIIHFGDLGGVLSAARKAMLGDSKYINRFERELLSYWGVKELGPGKVSLPPWPEHVDPLSPPYPRQPIGDLEVIMNHPFFTERYFGTSRWPTGFLKDTYEITSISPPKACPGETIIIAGSGFGNNAGVVKFSSVEGGTVDGLPSSWSDKEVTVVVPTEAVAGRIYLSIYSHTVEIGNRMVDINKPEAFGSFTEFDGGRTHVWLGYSGSPCNDMRCALPGSEIQVHWGSSNARRVDLEIKCLHNQVLFARRVPLSGTRTQALPGWTTSQRVSINVTATGECGVDTVTREIMVEHPFNLTIDGMELTQAIQHYRAEKHLTNSEQAGPDNSLALVAGKGALLRVYLRSGQNPNFNNGILPNVTGTCTVYRHVAGRWQQIEILHPNNSAFTAHDSYVSYDAERRSLSNSLNFSVPAAIMSGQLRFLVELSAPAICSCSRNHRQQSLEADVTRQRRLDIRAVRFGYEGENLDNPPVNVSLEAPTIADIRADLAFTLASYPVSSLPIVREIDVGTVTEPLAAAGSDNPGGCGLPWIDILADIEIAANADGNNPHAIYYGWLPEDTPRHDRGTRGCARRGSCAGSVINPIIVAHEIGHILELPHSPCGEVGTVNEDYPRYEPYDSGIETINDEGNTVWHSASIGEYGVNVQSHDLFHPSRAKDIMSYCGPAWISIFTHNYSLNRDELRWADEKDEMQHKNLRISRHEDQQPLIKIVGVVHSENSIEVKSVSRLVAHRAEACGLKTQFVAELIGKEGLVLAEAPVFGLRGQMEGHDDGCRSAASGEGNGKLLPPYVFKAVLSDVDRGEALRIRAGKREIWRRDAPPSSLLVDSVNVKVVDDEVHFQWQWKTSSEVSPTAWLRWSEDGMIWNSLAVGVTSQKYKIDASSIPADKVCFQVLVHDGFETISATSRMIELPPRPAAAAILYPPHGEKRPPGKVHLVGYIADPGTQKVRDQKAEWYLDGKLVADELDTWVTLEPGDHDLELRLTGADPVVVRIQVGSENE